MYLDNAAKAKAYQEQKNQEMQDSTGVKTPTKGVGNSLALKRIINNVNQIANFLHGIILLDALNVNKHPLILLSDKQD